MDLIDRQAAIDAVLHHGEIENNYTDLYYDGYCDGVYDSADMLKGLPSAQTERERGKWIPCKELAREMLANKTVNILYDHYECSLCRCTLPNLLYNQDGEPIYKFCPNCGAKMEVKNDE